MSRLAPHDDVVAKTYSGSNQLYRLPRRSLCCSEYGGITHSTATLTPAGHSNFDKRTGVIRNFRHIYRARTMSSGAKWFPQLRSDAEDFGDLDRIQRHCRSTAAIVLRPGRRVEIDICSSHFPASAAAMSSCNGASAESIHWAGFITKSRSRQSPSSSLISVLRQRRRCACVYLTRRCSARSGARCARWTLVRPVHQFFVDGGAPDWQQLNRRTVFRLRSRTGAGRIGMRRFRSAKKRPASVPPMAVVAAGSVEVSIGGCSPCRGTDHAPLQASAFPQAHRKPTARISVRAHFAQ